MSNKETLSAASEIRKNQESQALLLEQLKLYITLSVAQSILEDNRFAKLREKCMQIGLNIALAFISYFSDPKNYNDFEKLLEGNGFEYPNDKKFIRNEKNPVSLTVNNIVKNFISDIANEALFVLISSSFTTAIARMKLQETNQRDISEQEAFLQALTTVIPSNIFIASRAKDRLIESSSFTNLVGCLMDLFNSKDLEIKTLLKVVEFWKELLADKQNLFLILNGNLTEINRVVIEAMAKKQITVYIPTCPDYKADRKSVESGKTTVKFTFDGLGNGEGGEMTPGVVFEKALPLVVAVKNTFEKIGVSVKIEHLLPSFEFGPDGYKFKVNGVAKQLTKPKTTDLLRRQLASIQQEYIKAGIDASVSLTSDNLITDEDFFKAVGEVSSRIAELRKKSDDLINKVSSVILKERFNMYKTKAEDALSETNFENDETKQAAIRAKIEEIHVRTLAEYIVLGAVYTVKKRTQGNENIPVLALDASSSVMGIVYASQYSGFVKTLVGDVVDNSCIGKDGMLILFGASRQISYKGDGSNND